MEMKHKCGKMLVGHRLVEHLKHNHKYILWNWSKIAAKGCYTTNGCLLVRCVQSKLIINPNFPFIESITFVFFVFGFYSTQAYSRGFFGCSKWN